MVRGREIGTRRWRVERGRERGGGRGRKRVRGGGGGGGRNDYDNNHKREITFNKKGMGGWGVG